MGGPSLCRRQRQPPAGNVVDVRIRSLPSGAASTAFESTFTKT